MNGDDRPWRLPDRSSRRQPIAVGEWLAPRLATVPGLISEELQQHGLIAEAPSAVDQDFILGSQVQIESEADLCAIVQDVVGELHLLWAPPGYDVSHSEPRWPDRIFVSVPDRQDEVGTLRFAEGVIHEAMHLELTLQERVQPLIVNRYGQMASPWRKEPRPYEGVLHGLFVFSCLSVYFQGMLRHSSGATMAHARARLAEIRSEIAGIDLDELAGAATPNGACLIRQWAVLAT